MNIYNREDRINDIRQWMEKNKKFYLLDHNAIDNMAMDCAKHFDAMFNGPDDDLPCAKIYFDIAIEIVKQ